MGKNTPNFTQADFENQFEFFGFSHGASTFGQNNESTRKVATQVAGALTIENNGNDEVYLGAEMGWSLYSIDPDTRKKELENAPELHWGKKHKMGAVWKVIPYGERSYFLHDALTQTFEDKYAEYANDFSVLIDENRSLVPLLQAARIQVRYEEARDGHNWENWRDRLREGLSWVFPGPLMFVYE